MLTVFVVVLFQSLVFGVTWVFGEVLRERRCEEMLVLQAFRAEYAFRQATDLGRGVGSSSRVLGRFDRGSRSGNRRICNVAILADCQSL